MRRSIATVSVSGGLEEKLRAIAAAKFDGIELCDVDLTASDLSPAEIADRCSDLGLTIELFQPVRAMEGLDAGQFQRALHRLDAKLETMEMLGATTLLVCSNTDPSAIGDIELSAEQLRIAAQRAGEHGITVAFEALAWGTHINRIGDAWGVVRLAGEHYLRLVVDTFHVFAKGDDARCLDEIPGEQIAFLQIADASSLRRDLIHWSRHHRCFPGQGMFDVTSLVNAVIEKGYRGPLSLEVFSDIIRESDPYATARDGIRSLVYLEEQLRHKWAASPVYQRPQITMMAIPAAPGKVSCEFIEISVVGDEAVVGLLRALGFACAGIHRTKRVSWWRSGRCHIILNGSSEFEDRWGRAPSRPSVTGFAVSVPSISDASERSDAMLWRKLPLRHDVGEAPRGATVTPSGVNVFMVEGTGWQGDFIPARMEDRVAKSSQVSSIDHLGYRIGYDVSDAEVSFYRTLLGLSAGPVSEFSEPHGWMRSRFLRSHGSVTESSLQIVLNVDGGSAGTVVNQGINQVAFAVSDIRSVLHSLSSAGIGILQIPNNYYENLCAEFDLDATFVAMLREDNIMYDEDLQGGSLLHAYTRYIAGAFYIELVQRNGGYGGFGVSDALVRIAAQSRQTEDARTPLARGQEGHPSG